MCVDQSFLLLKKSHGSDLSKWSSVETLQTINNLPAVHSSLDDLSFGKIVLSSDPDR